jgi:Fic family protein
VARIGVSNCILSEIDELQKRIQVLRPFEPPMLEQIKAFFRVGMVWSSNAIEGFSYTEMETKVLLEDGLTVGGKPLRDALAVIGHAEAYDRMFTLLRRHDLEEADVLQYHALLRGSLDNEAVPGCYRQMAIRVTGSEYKFPDPEEVPTLMAKFFREAESGRNQYHPVEFAAKKHLELVSIHPFADGNGRVGRLVMNTLLIQDGFLPTIIPPILRHEYYSVIETSHMNNNERQFIDFIGRCELETQKEMLRHLEPANR